MSNEFTYVIVLDLFKQFFKSNDNNEINYVALNIFIGKINNLINFFMVSNLNFNQIEFKL